MNLARMIGTYPYCVRLFPYKLLMNNGIKSLDINASYSRIHTTKSAAYRVARYTHTHTQTLIGGYVACLYTSRTLLCYCYQNKASPHFPMLEARASGSSISTFLPSPTFKLRIFFFCMGIKG